MAKKADETKAKAKADEKAPKADEKAKVEDVPEVEEEPKEKVERYRAVKDASPFYYRYGTIGHEWCELDGDMPESMAKRIELGLIEVESEVK